MDERMPWDSEPMPWDTGGNGITSTLLDALKHVESRGNINAVSPAGARGPYQFMPATAKQYGLADPHDEPSARGAAKRYLTDLTNKFGGDTDKALLAYNWGPGNVDRYLKTGGPIPVEAQQYVGKVRAAEKNMSGQSTNEETPPWKIADGGAKETPPWKIADGESRKETSVVPAAPATALPKTIGQNLKAGVGNIMAAPEILANLGTGTIGQAVGGLAGLAGAALPGPQGQGAAWSQKVSNALTYQPQTNAAQTALGGVGKGFEYANEKLGQAGEAVGGNVGRSIGENAIPVAMTVAPVPKLLRQARVAAALPPENMIPAPLSEGTPGKFYAPQDVTVARNMAEKLRAHDLAQENKIATVPSETNPTRTNRMGMEAADVGEVEAKLSRQNESQWGKMLANDPDIDIRGPLSAEAIKAVRDRAAQSSGEIAKTGLVLPSEGHLGQIEGLRAKPTVGGKAAANEVNTRVNEAIDLVKNGADASELLRNISQLRKDARTTFKRNDAGVDAIAGAEANLKLANTFEDMLDTHLSGLNERNPHGGFDTLGEQYRNDRRTMAKSYTLDEALDHNTGKIDPGVIARITASDNALTGKFADVGKIAGNFPSVSKMNAPSPSSGIGGMHFSRFGPSGMVGTTLGGLVGGAPGAFVGGATTATMGELLGRALRNRSGEEWVQNRGVNPIPQSLWDLSGESPIGSSPKANPLGYDRPTPGTSREAPNNRQIPLTRAALESAIKKLREE